MSVTHATRRFSISVTDIRMASFLDLAASGSTRADYTVIATGGMDEELNLYIIDIKRGRWEWPQARQQIKEELIRQGTTLCGVETNGFQISAFQELIIEPELAHVAFVPVPQSKDKTTRALIVSAKGANGKLYIRQGAAWKEDLVYEFCTFPGRHDDIVDAVSGLAELLLTGNGQISTTGPTSAMKGEGDIKIKRSKRRHRRYR